MRHRMGTNSHNKKKQQQKFRLQDESENNEQQIENGKMMNKKKNVSLSIYRRTIKAYTELNPMVYKRTIFLW